MKLQSYLVRLIWICIAPLLLLAAYFAANTVLEIRHDQKREAQALAANFAAAVDRQLQSRIGALQMLATSPLMRDRTRWRELHEEAQGFRQAFGTHVLLADTAGQMLLNTRKPFGEALPKLPQVSGGKAAAPTALATGKPAVGDQFVGPIAKERLVALAVPVFRDGKAAFVLLTTIEASLFQKSIDEFALPADWTVTLLDGKREAIAHRAIRDGGDVFEGMQQFTKVLEYAPWSVVVDLPNVLHSLSLVRTALAAGFLILAAVLAAVWGGRHAGGKLIQTLQTLAANPQTPPPTADQPVNIAEIEAIRHALAEASEVRRRAEADVTASERRLRLAQDAARAGTWEWDVVTNQNYWSAEVFKLYGLEVGGCEPSHEAWRQAVHPADRERAARIVGEAASKAEPIALEWRVNLPAGEERWLMSRGQPRFDVDGKLASYLGIVMDITERMQAEERLRLWGQAFEQSNFGLVMSDPREQKIIAVNPAFARRRGYQPAELAGMPVSVLFPADRLDEAMKLISQADETGHVTFETEHQSKNGERFPVLVDITAYKDAAGVPTSRIVYSMDITDRKRSEAALLTSERRFHDIVEASADWVWEVDADCRYTYVSESVEAILGFAPDEVIGRTPFDLMPPDEADRVAPAFAAILARKAPFRDLDNINRHKDGRLLHMQTNGTPIVDQKGEVVGYRGLDRDVTPQKLAEAGLRESQQRLRMLVTAIPDLVWLKDPNGIYLACNARFEQFFGAREAEIVGKTDHDFIPRELADFFRANDLAAIAAGGPVINEEEVAFASDGHRELLQTIKTPIFDDTGRVLGVLGISRDIAQIRNNERELDDYRKHLEQMVSARTAEVEAAKNRTQLILDSSAEGLIGLDHLGNVTLCNPSALAMLGYELEDLLGRNVHAALHCKPFDREAHAVAGCAILRAIQDGRAIRVDHDTFWDVHGNPVSVSAAAHPIIEDGRCVGGVMNFQNISDRLKAETAREEAKLAAERLAKSKSEFLANMSHEIRTPLNGVLGMAQIGYRDNAGRGKAQETFARILDSGRLLLTIINDILDFSKIEAGKLEMETVPLAPADLVDDAISTMSAAAAAKGLGLVGEKLPELPTACLGDPVRIAQILLNLLANAVKFTAQGEVRLSASREGDSLVFRVTDSGIGISPEQIERLFIPFEQADSSTTRKFGGTGLGLAISRRLAEAMGGTLTATSAAGQGSAFTLRLPLKETEQPVARRAVTQDTCENRLSGLRILAAEDNEVNQLVLEDFLTREGAEVRMVGNGRLAVEAVERGDAFDVVLMDIQMPEMDGLEATKKIRRIAPTLPVIGQTAHALKEEHQRSLAAGMVATITKPIDIEMLVTTVLGHVRVLGTGPTMPALVVDSEAPPVQQAIEWDVLARRYPSRPQFVDRLVAMAIQGHEKDAEKLRELVRAGNLPEIGKFAHNLKGLAGNLCAPELAREAVRVMHTAGAGSPEALTQSQDLADAVERLLSELHKRRAA